MFDNNDILESIIGNRFNKNEIYYIKPAKSIWDKTYAIYNEDFQALSNTELACDILWCISLENSMDCSIFDVINIEDDTYKVDFFKRYFEINNHNFRNYTPNFLKNNIEVICQSSKLNKLLVSIEETLSELIPLFDLPKEDYSKQKQLQCVVKPILMNYLFEYEKAKTNKEIIKKTSTQYTWILQSKMPKYNYWKDDDIVLEDMAYVWPSEEGYSRFLDKNARWGFIDVIINKRYYMPDDVIDLRDYKCGRAVYLDKNSALYGFIDLKGNVLIKPKFSFASDFVAFSDKKIATVKLSQEEEFKLNFNHRVSGLENCMLISIFNTFITIDTNGDFTSDIKKIYDEEKHKYEQRFLIENKKSKQGYQNTSIGCCESEDDIIDALEGGFGDIYGF